MAILKYLRVGDTAELKPAGIRWVKIPGHGDNNANMSGLILESEDGSDFYMWFTDAGALHSHNAEPSAESDGSAIAAGSTQITASSVIGDDRIVRGHGGARVVQSSGITVAETTDNVSGMGTLSCKAITSDASIIIADAGNIGSASATDALAIGSAGKVTLKYDAIFLQDIVIGDGKLIGSDTKKDTITISSAGLATFGYAVAITGTLAQSGISTFTADMKLDSHTAKFYLADDQSAYLYADATNLYLKDATLAEKTLSQLFQGTELNPIVNGTFTLSGAGSTFTWADSTDETAGSWTFANTGAGSDLDIVSVGTTGESIHIVADSITSGKVLYIQSDHNAADGTGIFIDVAVGTMHANGNFLTCFNGAADVFEIGKYGAVITAGNASGTAVLTATKGDLVLADGVITADLAITTGTGHNLSTAGDATADTTFVTIDNSAAALAYPLLLVDGNMTGAVGAVDIEYAGTAEALHFDIEHATGDGIRIEHSVASSTGQALVIDMSSWVGTAGQGIIDISSDSGAVAEAGHAIYIDLGGTTADAAAISGKGLYIKDAGATKAGSYLVHLESTNNDAMYVSKGGILVANAEKLWFGTSKELAISNDGSQSYLTITDPLWIGAATTNYAAFAADGQFSFAGTARPTQYLYFTPGDFYQCDATPKPQRAIVPTSLADSWLIDGTASEAVATSFRTPWNWASGTDMVVKIYYAANDANTKVVKWDIHTGFRTDGTDNVSTTALTLDTVNDTMAGAAYVLNVATITIAAADIVADEYCTFKVERDSSDAADTLDGVDVHFIGAEIAYTANKV